MESVLEDESKRTMDASETTLVTVSPLDETIAAWLQAKTQKSSSTKTRRAYEDTLTAFRVTLQHAGLDLDRVREPEDRRQIAFLAQSYAAWSVSGKQVAPATYNQRLAILSSFYRYAKCNELVEHNPIERVERARVVAYGSAQSLEPEVASLGLHAIDRTKLLGKRDYALLALLLQTGRRLSEVQALTWGDLRITATSVTVVFACKGHKTMRDTLAKATGEALLDWLQSYYGKSLAKLPKQTPIWVSLAKGPSHGHKLGIQGVASVCQKYLGTSKVHTMRHTFAHTMESIGASVSTIQTRLGHESLSTTGRYLAQLRQAENHYAETLASVLGIE